MSKDEIIQELLDKKLVKIGESANYKRIQEIQKSSGFSHMGEYEFAELLGINNVNFNNVKSKGQNAIVLKDLIPMDDRIIQEQLLEDLLGKRNLEAGQLISHSTFVQIHEEYLQEHPHLTEAKLGRFLEIGSDSLYRARKGKQDLRIYKSRFDETKIIESLIEEKIAIPGDKIKYKQFLSIYDIARNRHPSIAHYSQYAVAKLLGIRKSTFTKFKAGDVTLQILKKYMKKTMRATKVSEEERNLIVEELMDNRNAKPYEDCDYPRFNELRKGYEYIPEYEFALILDMSNFSHVKNNGKKAKILKDCFDQEKFADEILESGKLVVGEEITASKFYAVHNEYNYMPVSVFSDTLEISKGTLERICGDRNATTIVFRSRIPKEIKANIDEKELNNEKAKKCVSELFRTGKIYYGQKINYQDFKKIYCLCNFVSEIEFSALLGISNFKYQNIKFNGGSTYILNAKAVEAMNIIGPIEKNRFYHLDEINRICKEYDITREEFITYIIFRGNYKVGIEPYLKALHCNDEIYVGRTSMSNQYFEKIYEKIELPINRLIGSICKQYNILRLLQEYKVESMSYVYEKCGDVELNFSNCQNENEILYILLGRVKYFLLDKISKEFKISKKQFSLNRFYSKKNTIVETGVKSKEIQVADEKQNTEEIAISNVISETVEAKIMCDLIIGFENGLNKVELLDTVGKKFNVTSEQLLKLLEKRLEVKKRRQAENVIVKK